MKTGPVPKSGVVDIAIIIYRCKYSTFEEFLWPKAAVTCGSIDEEIFTDLFKNTSSEAFSAVRGGMYIHGHT